MKYASLRHLQIKKSAAHLLVRTTTRAFTLSLNRMVDVKDLSPSKGEDGNELAKQVTELVDKGRWTICNDGKGLEREFKFKTFKATWEFMNHVAAECKKQKHHPEWTNIYNKTHIRWTTHNPEGLSSKDTNMAHFCDDAGEQFGETPADAGEKKLDGGSMKADDCCGGKKAEGSL